MLVTKLSPCLSTNVPTNKVHLLILICFLIATEVAKLSKTTLFFYSVMKDTLCGSFEGWE